jgi:hypothetical protein
MERKAYVRSTRSGLIFGLIVIAAFLAFGVWFFTVLQEDGSEVGMVFMAFWILIILLMGGALVHNLRAYDKKAEASMADEIILPDGGIGGTTGKPGEDFDSKLRKLEGLRKDALITEAEFARKRTEIMNGKW